MYLSEQAVTPAFRAAVAALVPALGTNRAYWRFMGYLMFAAGNEGGELMIPAPLVALIEGKKVSGRYSANRFLERFQVDTGITLTIKGWTLEESRSVTRVHWTEELRALMATERRTVGEERVLFSTGAKWRREHSTKDRQEIQAEAIETLQNLGHHPAYDLLNLLNHAAPNRFSAVKKFLEEAHTLVDSLGLVDHETERQHNILKSIEKQAQPFYGPAQRSVRIFAINDSLTRLQRDVRMLLTQEWVTADLRSAQLAIVAKVWGIPEVTAFLKTKQSIWRVLCEWMGLDFTEHNKAIVKDALYGLIFGAGRDKMTEFFTEKLGPNTYKRFKGHRLIRALLLARARQLRKIRGDKEGVDAFAQRH